MTHHTLVNMGEVTSYIAQYSDMLGRSGELDGHVTYMKRCEQLAVLDILCVRLGEDKKFRFPCRQLDLMFSAIKERKIQQALKLVEIMGEESRVIRLAHGSCMDARDGGSKATSLRNRELLVVVYFPVFTAIGPPLLDSRLVLYWSHCLVLPLAESGAVGQTEVPEKHPLIRHRVQEESPKKDLADNKIKGRFCV